MSRWSEQAEVGGAAVRNGPPEESRLERGAEQRRLLLCCREKRSLLTVFHDSLRNLSPLFLHPDAWITFPRRYMCVLFFVMGIEETQFSDCLPGVFLCPVITASPVTGCNQVVLFASSLLVEGNGGKGEQRTRKRQTGKNASEK